MANQRRIATLSFAAEHKGGIDLWMPVETTGSYSGDNNLGRSRADELVQYMADNQAPMALGHVAQAIILKGQYGAVEIGFFGQLALLGMLGFTVGPPVLDMDAEARRGDEALAAHLHSPTGERRGVQLLN